MKPATHSIGGILIGLAMTTALLQGCSLEQIREAFYNAGNDISCQQSKENLPEKSLKQLECKDPNAEERVDYRRYRDLRDESWEEDF